MALLHGKIGSLTKLRILTRIDLLKCILPISTKTVLYMPLAAKIVLKNWFARHGL